jgi:hypothetical protein
VSAGGGASSLRVPMGDVTVGVVHGSVVSGMLRAHVGDDTVGVVHSGMSEVVMEACW